MISKASERPGRVECLEMSHRLECDMAEDLAMTTTWFYPAEQGSMAKLKTDIRDTNRNEIRRSSLFLYSFVMRNPDDR